VHPETPLPNLIIRTTQCPHYAKRVKGRGGGGGEAISLGLLFFLFCLKRTKNKTA